MTFQVAEAVLVLERTPRTLRAMLSGLSDSWIMANEGAETFSPFDNLGHLIHGERTDWIARAEIVLAQGASRTFEAFDRFAHVRESEGKRLTELLEEFATLREENLAKLIAWDLTDAQLALQGEHPSLGSVTLRQLLATWVAHDLGHVAQIARVMAKQYREEVGPWRAYLPILDR
jgi:uncharacterized damage-inducible protein DinB